MKYLLDTNVCIRYLNGQSDKIRQKLSMRNQEEIALCSVVKAELIYGVQKSGNPAKNMQKLSLFVEPFISLPFDDKSAQIYGQIRSKLEQRGTPIGPNDLMIAAIAISNDMILVTHNILEFGKVDDLYIEDWEN